MKTNRPAINPRSARPRTTLHRLATLSAILLLAPLPSAHADDEPIPPQVQSAIDRGLEWLAKNQDSTGGWNAAVPSANAAVTSLAVMAFMARGHVPGQGPYGENINRGVDYILSLQQPDGTLAVRGTNHTMYDHGISTVMLCEAYGMLDKHRQQLALVAISSAVKLILVSQDLPKPAQFRGGWRYTPASQDADTSVTGWQLMALRGAANIGANIPHANIQAGIAYIKRQAQRSGGFSYTGGINHTTTALTGTGILSLELLGQHNTPEALAGGNYLIEKIQGGRGLAENYFYTVYYCAQAAWQLGGKYWDAINPPIRASLLQKQRPDGAWFVENTVERQGGDAYCTSMAILALAVPYRYLPLYQR